MFVNLAEEDTYTQAFFFFNSFTLQKKVVTSKVYDGSYSKAECDVTQ